MSVLGYMCTVISCLFAFKMLTVLTRGVWLNKFWLPSESFQFTFILMGLMGSIFPLLSSMTDEMYGYIDQSTKMGSLCFLCIVTLVLMPSLSSMDDNKRWEVVDEFLTIILLIIASFVTQVITKVVQPTPDVWLFGSKIEFSVLGWVLISTLICIVVNVASATIVLPTKRKTFGQQVSG